MRTSENNLGVIVKASRLNKGLTQEVLAERVGVGLRHIMGIENEGNIPSYEVLYALIRELHIPADLIFYPEKQSKDPQIEDIVRMLYYCDERALNIVRATIQAAIDSQSKQ